MKYLAICAIHKQEGHRLREWIEYHVMVGIEHFYLFDSNTCDDGTEGVLRPYIEEGLATNQRVKSIPHLQPRTYNAFLSSCPDCRWVAFIDVDEFLLPLCRDSVNDVLPEYEKYAGVAVSWNNFATSGHTELPKYVTVANIHKPDETKRRVVRSNRQTKTIANPAQVFGTRGAHTFFTVDNTVIVNEEHRPIRNARNSEVCHGKLLLNHYLLRSVADFRIKTTRVDRETLKVDPNWFYGDEFFANSDFNDIEDRRLVDRFGDELVRRCEARESNTVRP